MHARMSSRRDAEKWGIARWRGVSKRGLCTATPFQHRRGTDENLLVVDLEEEVIADTRKRFEQVVPDSRLLARRLSQRNTHAMRECAQTLPVLQRGSLHHCVIIGRAGAHTSALNTFGMEEAVCGITRYCWLCHSPHALFCARPDARSRQF